jgi:predicted regulator of Ras-like GTPase activity (Roadblock/LC7/MglB family)
MQPNSIRPILSSLRDVAGVEGAFLLAGDGALVDKDLPAMFDAELFREVGPRVVRLRETFASIGDEMDTCTIRFADFKLHIRAIQRGFLCILSSIAVNMPALRMGVLLAQRRILAELEPRGPVSALPPPATLATPTTTSGIYAPASQPPAPSRSGLTYRGRPVK